MLITTSQLSTNQSMSRSRGFWSRLCFDSTSDVYCEPFVSQSHCCDTGWFKFYESALHRAKKSREA